MSVLNAESVQRVGPGSQGRQELAAVIAEVEKVLAGKRGAVEMALTALLAKGHILLEDVPGVGKTTLARALSRALDLPFGRIQFTSDMLPSDVVGTMVYHPQNGGFEFRKGPLFASLLLADELNRTSPRTQSALLQAMSEGNVTVESSTHELPTPFFVIATQNPRELYGTYPLPESQLDRFLISISMGYPDAELEKSIIRGHNDSNLDLVKPVLSREALLLIQNEVAAVAAKDEVVDYLRRILQATRESTRFEVGASPRAGIQLLRASKAIAYLRQRDFVTPDDVRSVAGPVLVHRLALRHVSQGSGGRGQVEAVLEELMNMVAVP